MYTYTTAHLKQGGADSAMHWNQVGAMAQYLLSKRTSVYTQLVYQKASGGNTGTPLDTAFIPARQARRRIRIRWWRGSG